MYDYLKKSLTSYVKTNNVSHIENNGSRMWKAYIEKSKLNPKPSVNVVFSRYQHTEVSQTVLGDYGIVIAIPSYWIDVDPELVILFVSQYIDPWLQKYFGSSDDVINTNPIPPENNCDCGGAHRPHLPGTMPPPHHHDHHPPHEHHHPPHGEPPSHIHIDEGDPYKYGYPVPPGE